MLTCKSPRKVMLVAHRLARAALPDHASKFSRHDFTLPQLFACLVLKEHQRRSYRGAEALLRDAPEWCRAIGMRRPPDHNTLCRAAAVLLRRCNADKLLDAVARWAAAARVLRLGVRPLAVDGTCFDSRHVSRHYERRCAKARRRFGRGGRRGKRGRRHTIRGLPKLAVAAASACHLALAARAGTGAGSDHADLEPLVLAAWRRVPNRRLTVVADAGYDSERNHAVVRGEMGLRSVVPPWIGRPSAGPPTTRWRRHMRRLLATPGSRRRCGYTQRWQVETVVSMIKRNLGDALSGRTPASRKRDMLLKVLTHDVMIL